MMDGIIKRTPTIMTYKAILSFFIAIILACMNVNKIPVAAQSNGIKVNGISQGDLNGDGKPEVTTIDCSFATSHDRIYIVDQGGDMPISSNWQEATDFRNDIWMYDIGADNSMQLIVVYRVVDGHETAELYDDQSGDGQVKYEWTGTKITIIESKFWSAHIQSGSTWLLPNSRLNLNLHIDFDGPFPLFDRMPDYIRQDFMPHDGKVDAEFEEVAGRDGVASYILKRLLAPVTEYEIFERSRLESNEGHFVTRPFEMAFFPFLPIPIEPDETTAANLRVFDLPPYMVVDWQHGKIQGVGLNGTPTGEGQFCHDNYYIKKGQINDVSFECPLAYYDLSNNHDAFPELNIRMFYFTSGDLGLAVPERSSVDQAVENIYYSWSMASPDSLNWDYKVGLAGNYTIDEVEKFPDFTLRKVPFAEFPGWITDRAWKMTTFVARENRNYTSSEGIWEWDPLQGADPTNISNLTQDTYSAGLAYILGMTSSPPDNYFTTITQGFRAERNFADPAKPSLYFSPIDHKLHLLGAKWGIWNIDGNKSIEYWDRNNDGYLDEWQYLENNEVRQQINLGSNRLVYAGNGKIIIKQADMLTVRFESTPPRNHGDWLTLKQQLNQNQQDFAPDDFAAMVTQFNGQEMDITGAELREYRLTSDGFRFVLHLLPGFTFEGENWLDMQDRPAGNYVVIYDGAFHLQPLTSPNLQISFASPQPGDNPPTQYIENEIQVTLHNSGTEDAQQVQVSLGMAQSGQAVQWSEPQTIAVLAGESTLVHFKWAPEAQGEWKLQAQARLLDDGNNSVVTAEQMVKVQASQQTSRYQELSAFGVVAPWQVLLLLAGMGVTAGLAAWVLTRSLGREAEDPQLPGGAEKAGPQ